MAIYNLSGLLTPDSLDITSIENFWGFQILKTHWQRRHGK